MSKPTKYKVVTRRGIILDMVRYEGATVHSMTLVNEDKINAYLKHREAFDGRVPDEDTIKEVTERFGVYEAILSSRYYTPARWRSFMVKPEVLS